MGNHMQEMEQLISYQLKQKQHCLYVIGNKMKRQFELQTDIRSGRNIIDSTILHECIHCKENDCCKLAEEQRNQLGNKLEQQGGILPEQFYKISKCNRSEEWAKAANWFYEKELAYYQMEQQLIETRKLIGNQYMEASQTIGVMLSKEGQPQELTGKQLRVLQKCLKSFSLRIERGYRVSEGQMGEQLFLFLKGRKRGKYPVKEIGNTLSKTLGERWRPMPRMKQGMLGFELESKFHILSGIVSKAYEEKSGDNFSLYQISSGKYISMISDGMGTGNLANQDSKGIIEMMEELLETGVKEEAAIQCVQMMFSYLPRKERYSTLDYLQVNLESGIAVFLKMGACPSFLLRKDRIEVITFEGMPVGYGSHVVPMIRKKLEGDDFILQVSDGCMDGFKENGLQKLMEKIAQIKVSRPQRFVEMLMKSLLEDEEFQVRDDMTIIGLGIVDRY
ncbi:MAG: SpoIIE family protein phosphatase [Anaerostipes sp.]|nr:SpoIIE family protein phosphatase [Anaerostipes sp.]